jgi:MFS-type transporter involved in bile tolerance (Atg22 family)
MRRFLQIISWAALAATALAPVLYAGGQMSLSRTQLVMLLATIAWFATVPCWMGRPKVDEELII